MPVRPPTPSEAPRPIGLTGPGGPHASPAPVRPLDLTGRDRQIKDALTTLEQVGHAFARHARRSMPFLTRHRARIVPGPARIAALSVDESGGPPGPFYIASVVSATKLEWGALSLGPDAIALIVEASLGGSPRGQLEGLGEELTPAQRALIGRVARSLANDLAIAVKEEAGMSMNVAPVDWLPPSGEERGAEVLELICAVEGLAVPATFALRMNAQALEAAPRDGGNEGESPRDPHITDAVNDVPIELVAELGRISIGLRRILSLKAGDVLRLPTAVDDAIVVRVGDVEKFEASPILSRGQLAIEVRGRKEK